MKKGIWYAMGAYIIWGLIPLYWNLLAPVPAIQLIGHRLIWAFLFLFGWIVITRQWKTLKKTVINRRVLGIYLIAALLITIHWFTFVWAVGTGQVIEASLSYFINPLLSVFLGVVIMRERLRPLQWVPIGLVASGVLYLTLDYGSLPWIVLILAITFGLYGLVKKIAPLNAITGLTIETGLLFLPALGFLIYCELEGQGAFLHLGNAINLLLVGAGLVTTIPLLMFSSAAQSIPLTTIGVLQYIEPTIQFILGVLIFHEPFSFSRLIGFVIIWVAILLFTFEEISFQRSQISPVVGE